MVQTVAISLGLSHCEDLIGPELSWESSDRLKKLSCGGNHTMLLLEDGRLYGCGGNNQSQLSFRNKEEEDYWVEWQLLEGIFEDVTCGWDFTVVIDASNQLLARGSGLKGELGIGETKKSSHFTKIMDLAKGSKLFSSFQNCVVVEPYGKGSRVLGWGSNTKCQIRIPKCRMIDRPYVIYANENTLIDYVAMGKDFMLMVDVHSRIVHAQGFLPQEFHIQEWLDKPVQISCMWSSLHICYNGTIHSYGNNSHGQLYTAEYPLEIDSLTTGSEHGILIHNKNQVFCWGWGEHGNCGRINGQGLTNDYSNVVSPLNKIFTVDPDTTLRIYGGYASTWIVCEC